MENETSKAAQYVISFGGQQLLTPSRVGDQVFGVGPISEALILPEKMQADDILDHLFGTGKKRSHFPATFSVNVVTLEDAELMAIVGEIA